MYDTIRRQEYISSQLIQKVQMILVIKKKVANFIKLANHNFFLNVYHGTNKIILQYHRQKQCQLV